MVTVVVHEHNSQNLLPSKHFLWKFWTLFGHCWRKCRISPIFPLNMPAGWHSRLPICSIFIDNKIPERWRTLGRRAYFVSILAQKSSKDRQTDKYHVDTRHIPCVYPPDIYQRSTRDPPDLGLDLWWISCRSLVDVHLVYIWYTYGICLV